MGIRQIMSSDQLKVSFDKTHQVDARPVAVYDVLTKTCILIFKSHRACDAYVFNKNINYTGNYIKSKTKSKKNFFDRTLAFRNANDQQIDLLGDKDVHIINLNFYRDERKMLIPMFSKMK